MKKKKIKIKTRVIIKEIKKILSKKLMSHLLVNYQKKKTEISIEDHLTLEKVQVLGKIKLAGKIYCIYYIYKYSQINIL